ncbi:MAG: glycosyltransferase [Ruminococcaceae bacterium]|nr:glycosyltransferase [Oscillospiraceae bacterium]
MNTLPKVSIIIPVYNGSNYVKEAIDSAISQTYSNIEIIVVNDGSCDDGATEKIALSYGDKIRYFSKENGGVSSALNLGIKEMTGEYFSWLSHDDKYEADKVEKSIEYLAEFNGDDKLIVMCGAYYINEKSEKIRDVDYGFKKGIVYSGLDMQKYILDKGAINGCCMLIPKKAFEKCGGFNEDLRYNQDILMWLQFFCNGYSLIADLNEKNVMYRLHANQTSKTRRDLLVRDSYEMAKIIAPTFADQSTEDTNLIKMFAKRNAKYDCRNAVDECIRVGIENNKLSFFDVLNIRICLLAGKVRNVVKKIYHRIFFKK